MSRWRTALFFLVLGIFTPPWALLMICCYWAPHTLRRRSAVPWVRTTNWLIKHVLGITYEVRGSENIPAGGTIVLCKHQSAWETFALQEIFPQTVFVWKQELKRIPFFGWALAVTPSISIDRDAGSEALRSLVDQGRQRVAQGYNVIIFPEGTRAPPGAKRSYKAGGALVATATKSPVIPVALNSGEAWGRNVFHTRPGRVIVSIGPAIDSNGIKASALNSRVEAWIETEMRRISPHLYHDDVPTPLATGAQD